MAWQSGGGLPAGISSDGNGGLRVAGVFTAGTPGSGTAQQHTLSGSVSIASGQAELAAGVGPLVVEQVGTLDSDNSAPLLFLHRIVDHDVFHLTGGVLELQEDSANLPADEFILNFGGITSYIGGGLGLFSNFPQSAPTSVTGALSTVVDPAAKAVLTALVAAAIADSAATDHTT